MTTAKEVRAALRELKRLKENLATDMEAELDLLSTGDVQRVVAGDVWMLGTWERYAEQVAKTDQLADSVSEDPFRARVTWSLEEWAMGVDLATQRLVERKQAETVKTADELQ